MDADNDIDIDATDVPEDFKLVNRRQFMASGNTKYMLPIDIEERNRSDYQHYVLRLLEKLMPLILLTTMATDSYILHGNFNAPIEENLAGGIKVLEVGCGSGIWTLEMARDYPASTFVGCDIANVLPTTDISDNCTFINANTLEGLPFPDGTFDYCYQRFMVGNI
ncbi:hypothetical protein BC937DRAFT_92036 [Endogone sp. FLAS-F59071]|nr:hypothetical protein BC937DRAFT_92036 [Endogone sp. FLAS-F59071]|eukprot:RUS15755.1 hypothetical protein BC937DRAFT_92036 [Endogone sp. FLAS-F59071]